MSVPAGFTETTLIDPFERHVGPVFERGVKGAKCFALRVDERHINARGVVHGGMMLTFADAALGQAVWDFTDRVPSVTMNMQAQFIDGARLGELIEVKPELVRRTRALVFVRGDFTADSRTLMTISSVWKLLGES
ncbi:MAG TPA: PaaI family thioesterase [Rhizomicrobium sp.]|jgi:acyl-coenzyme A thioesterase PaaI-like protein